MGNLAYVCKKLKEYEEALNWFLEMEKCYFGFPQRHLLHIEKELTNWGLLYNEIGEF